MLLLFFVIQTLLFSRKNYFNITCQPQWLPDQRIEYKNLKSTLQVRKIKIFQRTRSFLIQFFNLDTPIARPLVRRGRPNASRANQIVITEPNQIVITEPNQVVQQPLARPSTIEMGGKIAVGFDFFFKCSLNTGKYF